MRAVPAEQQGEPGCNGRQWLDAADGGNLPAMWSYSYTTPVFTLRCAVTLSQCVGGQAAWGNHTGCLFAMLRHGVADVDAQDGNGNSCLHLASQVRVEPV